MIIAVQHQSPLQPLLSLSVSVIINSYLVMNKRAKQLVESTRRASSANAICQDAPADYAVQINRKLIKIGNGQITSLSDLKM